MLVNRRGLLARAAAISLLSLLGLRLPTTAQAAAPAFRRVRPSDPEWPSADRWAKLNEAVGGRLVKVQPLMASCADGLDSAPCKETLAAVKNPYFVGDQAAGTQTAGWIDAWMSAPSAYAVAARSAKDIAAAVNFARDNRLRLVVKGGGHSYQGTSDSANSLLIWTRAMNDIVLHDAFVPQGCAAKDAQPAVSLGAGVIWMHAYDAVTTKGGRYVQGGGCATVGVAGLIQSGGFGSFSKNYGTAAAGLLEVEIVTANGEIVIANACSNADLFWGIKGGGGGSLGVVTRLTLRTRELPSNFGAVNFKVKAANDAAFQRLLGEFVRFYAGNLLNSHWGESVTFGADNSFVVSMVFQGLEQAEAEPQWRKFSDWIAASPGDFQILSPLRVAALPARDWWNAEYLRARENKENVHSGGSFDDRPGAPTNNYWFGEQNTELGVFIHGFQSLWMPAELLNADRQASLAEALFAATRHWDVAFHFNKGLAGAHEEDVAAARNTVMNPAVLTAFALTIIAGGDPGAYADLVTGAPDPEKARKDAKAIESAADELRKIVPRAGSYVSESNFFEEDWQGAFWGDNYPRLREVKRKYDPDGLFFVHHGVGSEEWSADGFARLG